MEKFDNEQHDEPITAQTDEPITAQSDEPIAAQADEPITAQTDEPITAQIKKTITAPTNEPIKAPTDEPITALTDEPITAQTDKPITAQTDEPITAQRVSVVDSLRSHSILLDLGELSSTRPAKTGEADTSEIPDLEEVSMRELERETLAWVRASQTTREGGEEVIVAPPDVELEGLD